MSLRGVLLVDCNGVQKLIPQHEEWTGSWRYSYFFKTSISTPHEEESWIERNSYSVVSTKIQRAKIDCAVVVDGNAEI